MICSIQVTKYEVLSIKSEVDEGEDDGDGQEGNRKQAVHFPLRLGVTEVDRPADAQSLVHPEGGVAGVDVDASPVSPELGLARVA